MFSGLPAATISPWLRCAKPISLCRPGFSMRPVDARRRRAQRRRRQRVEAGQQAAPVVERGQRIDAAGELDVEVQPVPAPAPIRAAAAARGRGWRTSGSRRRCRRRRSRTRVRSSTRIASICGASRACAWRSAHSSLAPNGDSVAGCPLAQITSVSPRSISQRLSSPQTCRYDRSSRRAAPEIDPLRWIASSIVISGWCRSGAPEFESVAAEVEGVVRLPTRA